MVASSAREVRMLLGHTAHGFCVAAVRLPVRPLSLFDPHLDPLGQARVRIPELRTTHRECRSETFTRNALRTVKNSTPVREFEMQPYRFPPAIALPFERTNVLQSRARASPEEKTHAQIRR